MNQFSNTEQQPASFADVSAPLVSALSLVQQQALRAVLEQGLPHVAEPYLAIAQQLNATQAQVLAQISHWQQSGLVKRFGLVVKHRQLGFNANAMVVWNITDDKVNEVAQHLSSCAEVSLCYRRPRRLPDWPYNLFCMIHGKDRAIVLAQITAMTEKFALEKVQKDILFSFKAYKQQGLVTAKRGQTMDKSSRHAQTQLAELSALDKQLINLLQHGVPITQRPFLAIAEQLNSSEAQVLERLNHLMASKVLTRFGPMFDAVCLGGAFTLAALAVPEARFEEVTEQVNSFDEVAHNYRRAHDFNMWFVVGAESDAQVNRVLNDIEQITALPVLNTPKLEEFYVQLYLPV